MSGRLLPALLVAGVSLPFPWRLPTPHLPVAVERWLYNPRERTGKAIAESRQGAEGQKRAAETADTALRLAPDEPLVQYDGGTAHLAADDARGAAPLLDRAAQGLARRGDRDRAATAHYNLGNAHLAAGHAAAAVEAYKQALREAPADRDAKWNLELALREREREHARIRSPQEGNRGDQGGGRESSPKGGGDEGSGKSGGQSDPGKGRPQQAGEAPRNGEQGQGGAPRNGQQPKQARFHDLPEMSAAEASSILESVENLERQQRRAQAAEQARRRSAKVKDW